MDAQYWVQAYRKGQHTQWFTDSRHTTPEAAITAATSLCSQWSRKVRVIEFRDGAVLFRMSPPKEASA